MKLPMNYEDRVKLVDKITNVEEFNFDEILKFKQKNMLEDGDLFIIWKDGNKWFSIVYLQSKFFAITGDPKLVEISEKELSAYKYTIHTWSDNPYQEYIKRESLDSFNNLSDEDKCYVYADQYYIRHINETLDRLKKALSGCCRYIELGGLYASI